MRKTTEEIVLRTEGRWLWLAWVLLCGMICCGEALGCAVTDVDLYVAVTEAQAPSSTKTEILLCSGSTEYWARVRWEASEVGGGKDDPFDLEIYESGTVIASKYGIADKDDPPDIGVQEYVIKIDHAYALEPRTHAISARVRRQGSAWKNSNTCMVRVFTLDVDIHNGQGGVLVPEADEETIGSFTAANLNDTDGDGHPDYDDAYNPVVANGSLGRDEIDLMKLVLHRPGDGPKIADGDVAVEIVSGNVKIWDDSVKTNEITTLQFATTAFSSSTMEWWVEARSWTALQGIERCGRRPR